MKRIQCSSVTLLHTDEKGSVNLGSWWNTQPIFLKLNIHSFTENHALSSNITNSHCYYFNRKMCSFISISYYTVYYLEQNLPIYRNLQFGFTDIVVTTVKKKMSLEKKFLFFFYMKKYQYRSHTQCILIYIRMYMNIHVCIYIHSTYIHTWMQKGSCCLFLNRSALASKNEKEGRDS